MRASSCPGGTRPRASSPAAGAIPLGEAALLLATRVLTSGADARNCRSAGLYSLDLAFRVGGQKVVQDGLRVGEEPPSPNVNGDVHRHEPALVLEGRARAVHTEGDDVAEQFGVPPWVVSFKQQEEELVPYVPAFRGQLVLEDVDNDRRDKVQHLAAEVRRSGCQDKSRQQGCRRRVAADVVVCPRGKGLEDQGLDVGQDGRGLAMAHEGERVLVCRVALEKPLSVWV